MSNPEIVAAPAGGFEGQPVDSWNLNTSPGGEGRLTFPDTGRIWAAWETSEGFQADVFIRDRATGRNTMVIAPPANYSVTSGDELYWKLRSPTLQFRLGWGYLQGNPAES
jgi:hypothetical protein